MEKIRPVPTDFDAFWSDLAQRSFDTPPRPRWHFPWKRRVRRVSFTSLDGVRIGGWLVHPKGTPDAAVVVGHGYGGRAGPDLSGVPKTAAAFFPVARGLPTLSMMESIPSSASHHVLHGIASRETYVHGHCAADILCAVNAFEEILGVPLGQSRNGLRLSYLGVSFGGGIGAMALPWDARFDAAALHLPSFGAHTLRLREPSTGSAGPVRTWVREHPEAWDVLDYFDAATSATRIAVPTIIAPAATDPAVAPVGQWAVARAVPSHLSTIIPMTAGHMGYPQQEREAALYRSAAAALFAGQTP
ncbi:MAG: acetylxylan esterase [Arachnia sp.]